MASRYSDTLEDPISLTGKQVEALRDLLGAKFTQRELGWVLHRELGLEVPQAGLRDEAEEKVKRQAQKKLSNIELGKVDIEPAAARKLLQMAEARAKPEDIRRIIEPLIEIDDYCYPGQAYELVRHLHRARADAVIMEATVRKSAFAGFGDAFITIRMVGLDTSKGEIVLDHVGNANGPHGRPALLELVPPPVERQAELERDVIRLTDPASAYEALLKWDVHNQILRRYEDPTEEAKLESLRKELAGEWERNKDNPRARLHWIGTKLNGLIEGGTARVNDYSKVIKKRFGVHALKYGITRASRFEDTIVRIESIGGFALNSPDQIGFPVYTDFGIGQLTLVLRLEGLVPVPDPPGTEATEPMRRWAYSEIPTEVKYELGLPRVMRDGETSIYQLGPLARPWPNHGYCISWIRLKEA